MLQNFFYMLFAPSALAFDFSSDLDISAKFQAIKVLFIRMHFATIFSKVSTKEILIKNLHRKIVT